MICPTSSFSNSIRIARLSDLGIASWSRIVGCDPQEHKLTELSKLLSQGDFNPEFRLVAVANHEPIAGFAARAEGSTIRFWPPISNTSLGAKTYEHCASLFLDQLRRVANNQSTFTTLETYPGDDTPNLTCWLRILGEHGFVLAATRRIHRRADRTLPTIFESETDLSFSTVSSPSDPILVSLREKTVRVTYDREDSRSPISALTFLSRLGVDRFTPHLWFLARDSRSEPVGYAICSASEAGGTTLESAWILDVGVAPQFRRRGYGRRILAEAISRVPRLDGVAALIDDCNHPSIGLHSGLGFQPEHDRHMIFRRTLPRP